MAVLAGPLAAVREGARRLAEAAGAGRAGVPGGPGRSGRWNVLQDTLRNSIELSGGVDGPNEENI
ncbi:Protein of unknown function [Gryllus bimaculatus]|nr:Protein of unknown function [Gryllus bimaculatus]